MRVITNKKYIFMHIPKTGGSTVERLLDRFQTDPNYEFQYYTMHCRIHGASDFILNNLNDYTFFVGLRNTYERIASLYCMVAESNELKGRNVPTWKGFLNGNPDKFFDFIEFRNKLPDKINYIKFETLNEDIKKYWKQYFNIELEKIPHFEYHPQRMNKKIILLNNPKFIEMVREKYNKEIEYFNFKPPY